MITIAATNADVTLGHDHDTINIHLPDGRTIEVSGRGKVRLYDQLGCDVAELVATWDTYNTVWP